MLSLFTFWLKFFIDWLRGLSYKGISSNVNRNVHCVFKYLYIVYLGLTFEKAVKCL